MNAPQHPVPADPLTDMLAHTLDQHTEALPPASRGVVVAFVIALHLLAAWALMQVSAVREAMLEAAPIFVNLVQPEAPKPVVEPPKPPPRVVPRVTHTPPPIITTAPAPTPAPVAFEAPPAPPEPRPEPPPVAAAPVSPVAAPAPAPVRQAEPKMISVSEVRYKFQAPLVYPKTSENLGEQGEVLLRVLIDTQGHTQQVSIQKSSGYSRLDQSAIRAARQSSFYPHQENGQATAVWVLMPFGFISKD